MADRLLALRARAWAIVHTALAASLAWEIAVEVLGHKRPFFAPVSAIIALGITAGQRTRRAIELVLAVDGVLVAGAALVVLLFLPPPPPQPATTRATAPTAIGRTNSRFMTGSLVGVCLQGRRAARIAC